MTDVKHSFDDKKNIAFRIVENLQCSGYETFLAGGCVRDLIMNRQPEDFDIATRAKPEEIEKIFKKTIPVGKQFGVIIVVEAGNNFEVATFRSEGPYLDGRHPTQVTFTSAQEDAGRRDFTVNGIFFDPTSSTVHDYVGGEKDIHKKIIRCIGDPKKRFNEDKLRLLRAVRFACNLDFTIESNTWNALKEMAPAINQVSPERIREELIKLFTRSHADRGLDLLSDSGLLKLVLPEVENLKGVKQPPDHHPEGDVYVHTRMMMGKLSNPSVALAFGALLHDIGKPDTFSDENGQIHFYKHTQVGCEIAEKILQRLRFSNQEISDILSCIDNHMKFGDVQNMRVGKLKQFVSRNRFNEELELHRIDCESSHGKLDNYYFLKEKLNEYRELNLRPKPLINGDSLIEAGYVRGPQFKEILDAVYELQLEGKLTTKEEVISWLRSNYPLKKKP